MSAPRTATGQCEQCELLRISGVVCHETGCPNAWMDEVRECRECGCDFIPDNRYQRYCDCQDETYFEEDSES